MKLIFCVSACSVFWTIARLHAQEIPITSIDIDATPRGDQLAAIDNNFGTSSYLTAPVSLGPRTAFLGFDSLAQVNSLRIWKFTSDVDAIPENDPDYNELTLSYTSDSNPNLAARVYQPVVNLFSPAGPEQIVGTIDLAAATVHAEHGPGGAYRLSFDTVSATGFAFRFVATDPQPDGQKDQPQFTHYPVTEFEAFVPEPTGVLMALFGVVLLRTARTARY